MIACELACEIRIVLIFRKLSTNSCESPVRTKILQNHIGLRRTDNVIVCNTIAFITPFQCVKRCCCVCSAVIFAGIRVALVVPLQRNLGEALLTGDGAILRVAFSNKVFLHGRRAGKGPSGVASSTHSFTMFLFKAI